MTDHEEDDWNDLVSTDKSTSTEDSKDTSMAFALETFDKDFETCIKVRERDKKLDKLLFCLQPTESPTHPTYPPIRHASEDQG